MRDDTEDKFQQLLGYYDRLVNFIRGLGFDLEDARDLAQDVFVRVYEHRDDYRGDAKWNYLEQTARRLAYNTYRDRNAGKRRGIKVAEETLLEVADSRTPSADALVLQQQIGDRLSEVINRLEPAQRVCVVLFYISDRSYEEICSIVGISLSALKSRLNAARRRLKDLLGEEPQGWRELPSDSGDDS